jgi:hypothetical protein
VLVAFGPQGRRYEVWGVHQGVSVKHALVLAFDAAGAELWRSKYTWKPAEPWLGHLAATVDAAGDLYFMYITMPVGDVYRWRVAKVTAAGVLAWDKTLYSSTWGTIRRAHAPDDSVYLAWDHDNSLVSDWSLARIDVPQRQGPAIGEQEAPGARLCGGRSMSEPLDWAMPSRRRCPVLLLLLSCACGDPTGGSSTSLSGGSNVTTASEGSGSSTGAPTTSGASDSASTVPTSTGTESSTGAGETTGVKLDLGAQGDFGRPDGEGCRKLDFLFVIDNSNSMANEQSLLIDAFPGFVAAIEAGLPQATDFHIGVTKTDVFGFDDDPTPDPQNPCPYQLGGLLATSTPARRRRPALAPPATSPRARDT